MIFITLGSQKFQFDRLLKEVDRLIADGVVQEKVFAQIGASEYLPQNYTYERFLDRQHFAQIMDQCDSVITHGGTGVIIGAVKKGKKVVRNLKCRVRVSPNAVSIKFMKNQVSVPLSQRTRLETIIKPNTSAERPVFQSSDESIAIVNSRGVVMGVSPGTVTITATLLSRNLTASCVVTVLPDSTTSSTKPKKYYEKKKLQSIAY